MLQSRVGRAVHALLVVAAVALVVVAALDHSWLAVTSASLAGASLATSLLAHRRATRARAGSEQGT